MTDAFWSTPAAAALATLKTSPTGLDAAEAAARLRRIGPNLVGGERRDRTFMLFARQFKSPLTLILLFGGAISLGLGDWLDATIIFVIVGASAGLSFYQEYGATRAIAALQERLALKVRVLRGGAETIVPVQELVPGDVILLAAGSLIPADGLVLAANDCLVTEASLTGEALPVDKLPGTVAADTPIAGRSNALFMGSSLRSGTATMLVVETGPRTQFGEIAARLRTATPETEFGRGVRHFGTMLLRVMIVIVLAVLTVNQLLGRPVVESLLFAVALAVGLSPELLPAIISVTLAAGARELARGGVIVRRLEAIENLGSMDVLCTDKTGTITEGAIVLDAVLDPNGDPSPTVREAGFLNAALETGIANPLDTAIVAAGSQAGLAIGARRKVAEIPYDFMRRRLSIVVEDPAAPGVRRMITKGAFSDVLAVCTQIRTANGDQPLDAAARQRIQTLFQAKGDAGFRALAVAERQLDAAAAVSRGDEAGMVFTGLMLFLDPPKADAQKTLGDLAALGIAVKVISGDNRHVTAHVARCVGLETKNMLTGEEVAHLPDEALRARVSRITVFAEIDPQQKERIIRALQRAGHAVGYLGDGINDAPALHLADVGISVDQAVDVARESADVVLLHRDLDVLRQGVVAGRRTFANTLKYIAITTSANFGNMVSMALATPLLPFLPLLPKQILLNNFLSDLPSLAISSDNVDPEHIAAPQRWDVRQVTRFMIVFGLISSCFDLLTFAALLLVFHADEAMFQTVWFVLSVLTELAVVLVLRTRRFAFASRPSPLLMWSTGLVALGCFALPYIGKVQAVFGLVAIPGSLLGVAIAILAAYIAATEGTKRLFYRAARHARYTGHDRTRRRDRP